MRSTTRLLASVKPARFLEPHAPTGLTGLLTHPSPRPTLLYLYNSTLEKLKAIPASSLYRQSTEALTNHRLKIVQSVVPAGFQEWAEKSKKLVDENPEFFDPKHPGYVGGSYKSLEPNNQKFVQVAANDFQDENFEEDDLEVPVAEGTRTEEERAPRSRILNKPRPITDIKTVKWIPEPSLDADQISEIENQIGAGLIEEIIVVAKGELDLIDVMTKAKVWEELEEKPVEGQWAYFNRDTGTPTTQKPPQ